MVHYDTQILKEMLQSVSFDDSMNQSKIMASLKKRDEMKKDVSSTAKNKNPRAPKKQCPEKWDACTQTLDLADSVMSLDEIEQQKETVRRYQH